jgi:hypothetical protein
MTKRFSRKEKKVADYTTDDRGVGLEVGASDEALLNNIDNVNGQTVVTMAETQYEDKQPKLDATMPQTVKNVGVMLNFAFKRMMHEHLASSAPTFSYQEKKTLNRIMSMTAKNRMPGNALSFINKVAGRLAPYMSPVEKAAMQQLKNVTQKNPFPRPKGPMGLQMERTLKNYFPKGQQLDSISHIIGGASVSDTVTKSRDHHDNLAPETPHHPDYQKIKHFVDPDHLDTAPKLGTSQFKDGDAAAVTTMKRPRTTHAHGLNPTLYPHPTDSGGDGYPFKDSTDCAARTIS